MEESKIKIIVTSILKEVADEPQLKKLNLVFDLYRFFQNPKVRSLGIILYLVNNNNLYIKENNFLVIDHNSLIEEIKKYLGFWYATQETANRIAFKLTNITKPNQPELIIHAIDEVYEEVKNLKEI
jgi:hypothetical protein